MGKSKKDFNVSRDFGQRLRDLRRQLNISQDYLAEKLGYQTGTSVSNIEAGKSPIDAEKLYHIAKIFGADLHRLITGEPSPTVILLVESFRPQIEAHFKALQKERSDLSVQLVGLELGQTLNREDNKKAIGQAKDRITKIDSEQLNLSEILIEILGRKTDQKESRPQK